MLRCKIASWEADGKGRKATGNMYLLLKENEFNNAKVVEWEHETYSATGKKCGLFEDEKQYFEEIFKRYEGKEKYTGYIKDLTKEEKEKVLEIALRENLEIRSLSVSTENFEKILVDTYEKIVLVPATNGSKEKYFKVINLIK